MSYQSINERNLFRKMVSAKAKTRQKVTQIMEADENDFDNLVTLCLELKHAAIEEEQAVHEYYVEQDLSLC